MRRRTRVKEVKDAIALLVVIALSAPASSGGAGAASSPSSPPADADGAFLLTRGERTPRGPISIDSDAGFTEANGVVAGSGSLTDPFLMSGWEIDAGIGIAVAVRNTTRHFELRSSIVISAGSALVFERVQNASVDTVSVRGAGVVLDVSASSGVVIRDSRIRGTATGSKVVITDSTGVSVEGGEFSGATLILDSSRSGLVARNGFISGIRQGLVLGAGSVRVARNLFTGPIEPMIATGGSHSIESNVFRGGERQLQLSGGAAHSVENNSFSGASSLAIAVGKYAVQATIGSNNILASGARDDSSGTRWGPGGKGNHWGSWTGPDADGDGIVDLPLQIPGEANASDPAPRVAPLPLWRPQPPEAPGELVADGAGDGVNVSVRLSWKRPRSDLLLTEYVVLRGRNATSLRTVQSLDPDEGESYADRSVLPNKTLYYAVAGRSVAGDGPRSQVVEVMPVEPGLPDLAILSGELNVTPSRPGFGERIVVKAVLRNLATGLATSSRVRFYEGSISLTGLTKELLNLSVSARGERPVEASWEYKGGGRILAEVDQVQPLELRKSNNAAALDLPVPESRSDLSWTWVLCLPVAAAAGVLVIAWSRLRRFRHLPRTAPRSRP